jgi:hypothetical protein
VSEIWIDPADDAAELLKALRAEGYTVTERRPARAGEPHGPWALEVEPFDEGVIQMVDVYGGWLPDEE